MEIANPPNLQVVPRKFKYIEVFLGKWSYVLEPQPEENTPAVKRRVYNTLRGLKQNTEKDPRVRIVIKIPSTEWALCGTVSTHPFYRPT
jgi:hypothetical protein